MVAASMEGEFAQVMRSALGFIKSGYAGTSVVHGVSSDVPWPAIFRLASAASCLAALCDCVLSKESARPDEVTPLLELFRKKERERNREIAEVLDKTLTRLASRGVEAVALKGAAFLASGSASSRHMIDIDLLVRPRDKDKAFKALTGAGYQISAHDKWYETLNHHHAPPVLDPSGVMAIELHTRLAPNFDKGPISADIIFANAQIGSIGNSAVLVPSDNHRLLHLIIHSMVADNGYWTFKLRLRDLIDLLEIQKMGRVDWQALQATFAQIRYETRAAGFLLAAELLLSPAFQAPAWAASGRRWAERAVRAFFHPDLFRARRIIGQLLADIEATAQNPRRLRIILLPGRLKEFLVARCMSIITRGK